MSSRHDRLENGIQVLSEELQHYESCVVGIYIGIGAAHEETGERGYSHFIEHMLFKGTSSRSSQEISEAIEAKGGTLNGYTEKEYTYLQLQATHEHLTEGLEILKDMIQDTQISPTELEKEKSVIIEEIHMYKDSPEEQIYDLFMGQFWRGGLSQEILGDPEDIKRAAPHTLTEYYKAHYTGENITISLAGKFSRGAIFDSFTSYQFTTGSRKPREHSAQKRKNKTSASSTWDIADLEQVYMIWGFELGGHRETDPTGIALLDAIIGRGASSRLFREIREKRGLTYSIESTYSLYEGTGAFMIYTSSSARQYPKILEVLLEEQQKLLEQGIGEEELERAKGQIRGSLRISSELLEARIHDQYLIHKQKQRPLDYRAILEEISAYSLSEIEGLTRRTLQSSNSHMHSLGPKAHIRHTERFASKTQEK